MPERDKDVVKTLTDAFITKGKLKQLVLYKQQNPTKGRVLLFILLALQILLPFTPHYKNKEPEW